MALVAVLFLVALASTGCGGSGRPLPVKDGMTAKEVRAAAGRPSYISLRPLPAHGHVSRCWHYRRTETGKPIAVAVCFRGGRVVLVDWSDAPSRGLQ
jgi:hypothetical protein